MTMTTAAPLQHAKLAVWKFTSCDGCQLTLLDCEDQLLRLAETVDIAFFTEASSRRDDGPYDISLVEGSVSTPAEAERIRLVRDVSRTLVTIGACATSGGIQALRNFADVEEWAASVYATPQYVATLSRSTPISDHVPVDLELRGCPIDPAQLLDVVTSFVVGRKPQLPVEPVCVDCKRNGNACVLVAGGVPCLGPVTQTGCGALCPAFGRGCYGCFGPVDHANIPPMTRRLRRDGMQPRDVSRIYRTFNAAAEAFDRGGRPDDAQR